MSKIGETQTSILKKLENIENKMENVGNLTTNQNKEREPTKPVLIFTVEELLDFEESLKIEDNFFDVVIKLKLIHCFKSVNCITFL